MAAEKKPKLVVWMYLDDVASWGANDKADAYNEDKPEAEHKTGADFEYDDIEETLKKAFPDHDVRFWRNKSFADLPNANPDVYIWDIGGWAQHDWSGTQRQQFCNNVIRQIDDHPSTVFVPWSSITQGFATASLEDHLVNQKRVTEEQLEDILDLKTYCPPNLLLLTKNETRTLFGSDMDERLLKELKAVRDRNREEAAARQERKKKKP